jgi:glutathione peroxidase
MKKVSNRIALIIGLIMSFYSVSAQKTSSLYDYQFTLDSLEGGQIDFSKFKGKKVLFVNVASKCGYTSQYSQLQELHDKYKGQLIIIALPCNQFGNQEPGSSSEIADFCKKNYGVTFLVSEKIDVKGGNQNIIYSWLTQKSKNNVLDSNVNWNFQKYLIDEEGHLIKMFGSSINPLDSEITDLL